MDSLELELVVEELDKLEEEDECTEEMVVEEEQRNILLDHRSLLLEVFFLGLCFRSFFRWRTVIVYLLHWVAEWFG